MDQVRKGCPTAAPYMAGLKPSVAKRVAAYLEGMSLQQLRTLKPSGRKDVLSVRLQVCDTLSAHFIQSRMGPAQAGNKGFRGFLRCAYASGVIAGLCEVPGLLQKLQLGFDLGAGLCALHENLQQLYRCSCHPATRICLNAARICLNVSLCALGIPNLRTCCSAPKYLICMASTTVRASPAALQENTVEESLLDALKSGVVLPVDRLTQDFKFEGGESLRSI
eukprot:1136471-Pelagomonas_calceolata.AAC.18